ncbi:MAG: 4,5-DOPA dioxygenase extradiol [Acidobacteriota bacterium]
MSPIQPVLFFGHGSPMTTLTSNRYTDAWKTIGQTIVQPKAILCISAHWYVSGSAVTVSTAPETIHDFGGFPQALYNIHYPALGSPALARRVQALLSPLKVDLSTQWGLDHGTWSVLRHTHPAADIPVVQLSIDGMKPAMYHYEIGKRLAPLREDGVLIIGSGNLVHNLWAYSRDPGAKAFDWATRFDAQARELLRAGQFEALVHYEKLGKDAELSIPTPDHYLPLLYVLGAADKHEPIQFPVEGIDGASVSMLTVLIGEFATDSSIPT